MARYQIKALPAAEQDIADLPEPVRSRIIHAIDMLADNKDRSVYGRWTATKICSLRVGQYRVAYEIQDKILLVLIAAAGNRDKIYKLLRRRKV